MSLIEGTKYGQASWELSQEMPVGTQEFSVSDSAILWISLCPYFSFIVPL